LKSDQFKFDKVDIIKETKKEVGKVLSYLIKPSELKVTINGHKDYLAGASYHLKLLQLEQKALWNAKFLKGFLKTGLPLKVL
jgi:hypothetical protein